jgi:hypothetical protein
MGGLMTCYHRSLIWKKEKSKKKWQKREEEKEVIQFMINTPMLANWVQIKIVKTFFAHTSWSQQF